MKRIVISIFMFLIWVAGLQHAFTQTVSLDNITANTGEDILVPINFYGMTNLGAITLFIEFNESVLTFNGITNVVPEGNGTFYNYIPNPSRVGLSWIAPGMSGVDFPDGKYLDLQFTFLGGASDLIFASNCEIGDWYGNVINVTYINGSASAPAVTFNIDVFLEGAYQYESGGAMRTDLFNAGNIPANQPYSPVLPYFGNSNPAWYYAGTESTATIPAGTVDWVLIQLRNAATAVEATGATIVAQKACFLLSNGSVVDSDGNNPVFYTSFNDGAFVVIWHRNHLGIMSSVPVAGFGGSYFYDFTTGAGKVAGGSAGYVVLESGVWGMAAGDINADKIINVYDKALWEINAASQGYSGADANLDIQVNNPDKNEHVLQNNAKISGIPD